MLRLPHTILCINFSKFVHSNAREVSVIRIVRSWTARIWEWIYNARSGRSATRVATAKHPWIKLVVHNTPKMKLEVPIKYTTTIRCALRQLLLERCKRGIYHLWPLSSYVFLIMISYSTVILYKFSKRVVRYLTLLVDIDRFDSLFPHS